MKAPPGTGLDRGRGVHELDGRITERTDRLEVSAFPGVQEAASQVYVLLRHPPPSIPPRPVPGLAPGGAVHLERLGLGGHLVCRLLLEKKKRDSSRKATSPRQG